ncbi:MAG: hypothetical protein CL840_17960 [Crocinitomicaceae bacterium]|nr:hypothetical protein [Crocinitomicaceae bacterium]|tara:strand:- start:17372 stop:18058 length:687 start_codon:yes stop_codon:yes gene_type:complete
MDISIIIPTWNEEENIAFLIDRINNDLTRNLKYEIIIVDGGSSDNTIKLANERNVKLILTQKGRGNQLCTGAKEANGEILYFLHADSIPPPGFLNLIMQEIENGAEVGCFQLKFTPSNLILRFYEFFVGYPYLLFRGGDQSLFITRKLYAKIDGFNKNLKFMEDIDLLKRVNKVAKLRILKERILTSSRKYSSNGVIRLQLIFGVMHTLFWLNYSPEKIESFYYKTVV